MQQLALRRVREAQAKREDGIRCHLSLKESKSSWTPRRPSSWSQPPSDGSLSPRMLPWLVRNERTSAAGCAARMVLTRLMTLRRPG